MSKNFCSWHQIVTEDRKEIHIRKHVHNPNKIKMVIKMNTEEADMPDFNFNFSMSKLEVKSLIGGLKMLYEMLED